MKLIKYDNFFNDPQSEMDRFFNRAFGGLSSLPGLLNNFYDDETVRGVRTDVHLDEDNIYVTAELPGIDKKDIDIQLENAVLTISGSRKYKDGNREHSSHFSRSVTVGDDINSAKVTAKLDNGLLQVVLPRAEERKPKQIEVK